MIWVLLGLILAAALAEVWIDCIGADNPDLD